MDTITTQEAQKNGTAKRQEREAAPQPRIVTPAVDVYENADEVLVLADLPGAKADDVSLHIEKEALTLQAQRKVATFERPILFKRTFVIPNDLDTDRIEAKLDSGVLTVKLPRRASAKPRQIPVKT